MKKDFSEFKEFIKNKKVAVVGIGVSNIPLIKFLVKLGAVVSALLMRFIYIKSIWLITLSLLTIMVYYSSEVKRLGLKKTNL